MLPSDMEYAEALRARAEELTREIVGVEAAIAFIYERGERYTGEIGKHLSDLDMLRGQAFFAEVAVTLLETGKMPERKIAEHSRRGGDITDLMIERARAYPIDNLVEVKRGKALCPFHDDHKPSLSVKNNLFHCFVCEVSGDTIRFIMQVNDLNFIEAVKYLNG